MIIEDAKTPMAVEFNETFYVKLPILNRCQLIVIIRNWFIKNLIKNKFMIIKDLEAAQVSKVIAVNTFRKLAKIIIFKWLITNVIFFNLNLMQQS